MTALIWLALAYLMAWGALAGISLAWDRRKARQFAMLRHPSGGGRFEVATWDHAGRLTSVAGQSPDAWLEQQRGRS